ncbi:MAG: ATPase, T2SS/T4P/T4SS family [Candidatus Micrarchaeota archaeon]
MFSAKIELDYPFSKYVVEEAELPADQAAIVDDLFKALAQKAPIEQFVSSRGLDRALDSFKEFASTVEASDVGRPVPSEERKRLLEGLEVLASKIVPDPLAQKLIAFKVLDRLFGYAVVQPLFEDGNLEEIMVNGISEVFVFHRKFGMCKTNLKFENERQFGQFLTQMSCNPGRAYEDMRLPDGSRANILYPPTTKHTSVTIRKFRVQPMSIIDLINNKTFNVDLAAFLWVMIDGLRLHPLNLMIVGSTASGKTTTLNALSSFIPPGDRIVSMEDTLELNLYGMENWIPCRTSDEMDLDALVRNSLRMRPDRLIVGEVRGREAQLLFTAMNVGHRGMLTTLHSEDARDAVQRLQNFPMNVPKDLIPLVDIVIVQHRINTKKEGLIRRITQVAEIGKLEGNITVNEVFDFDPEFFRLSETKMPSQAKEKLSKAVGIPITEINSEIEQRKRLLVYLVEKDIHKIEDVNLFMQRFYSEMVNTPPEDPRPAAPAAPPSGMRKTG